MTVAELKKAIKSKKKSELEEIVMSLYKHIPKKIIADEGIDKIFLLHPVNETQNIKNKIDKELKLILETKTFNQHFLAGNYGIPNRTIPKAKRSKWRFEVMRFYKEVTAIYPDAVMKKELADLFGQLYDAMAEGCKHYLVTTEDCFAAIKKNQVTFFHQVIQYKKEFYTGEELYKQIWGHILDVGLSEEISIDELYETLTVCFPSPMAIEELVKVGKLHFSLAIDKFNETKKKDKYASTYQLHKMMEGLAILLLKIQDMEGVKTIYVNNLTTFSDKENMYFELVKTCINYCDRPGNELLNILKKATEEGIILRDTLAKLYKNLQKDVNCELPSLYY